MRGSSPHTRKRGQSCESLVSKKVIRRRRISRSDIEEKRCQCGAKWGKVVETASPRFIGTYEHNVDDKGRLAIPAKFRDGLGERFFATKGLDRCLFLFPESEWEKQQEQLASLPLAMRDARAYSRLFFAGACECELDRQGRINIPPYLREYAAINKDVVVIGVMNRVEVWSREVWRDYSTKAEESYEEIAEKLVHGGVDKV